MTLSTSLRAACLLLLPLAACERPAPSAEPPASAATPRAGGPLADVLSGVDTVTLGQWLAAHPGDVVADTARVGVWDQVLCRTATAPVEGTGGRLVRTALFELPDVASGDSLPATADPREWCRLRAVELSAPFPDSASAAPFADSLGRLLAAALGPPSDKPGIEARTDAWRHVAAWSAADRRTLLADIPDLHPAEALFEGEQAATAATRRVLVIAYAPSSWLERGDTTRQRVRNGVYRAEDAAVHALADSALAFAALPTLEGHLRPLLAEVAYEQRVERSPERDSAIVAAARLVHGLGSAVAPDRRAAALTALDFAVVHVVPSLPGRHSSSDDEAPAVAPDSALRAQLEANGVEYPEDAISDEPSYERSLLLAAFAADSAGRGGHAAMLALTELGWNVGSACGQRYDHFEQVLGHGEAALRRGDADPLTHYFVGLAWSDIVSMAGDRAGPYANDRASYVRRAPAARTKALAHLRAAVAGLRDPVLRADAWRAGMALLLGQSRDTRFYCVFED